MKLVKKIRIFVNAWFTNDSKLEKKFSKLPRTLDKRSYKSVFQVTVFYPGVVESGFLKNLSTYTSSTKTS